MPQYYGAANCSNFARARPRFSGSPFNITARPLAVISLGRGLGFPAHLKNASCGLPRGSKISEILGPFGKARGSKISEIFGAGGATKNLGEFWSRGPCLRSGFPRDLSLFDCLRRCSAERADPARRAKMRRKGRAGCGGRAT